MTEVLRVENLTQHFLSGKRLFSERKPRQKKQRPRWVGGLVNKENPIFFLYITKNNPE